MVRCIYSKVNSVCSASLYGNKISVACNPDEYLTNSYGKDWHKPDADNYTYENLFTRYKLSESEYRRNIKIYTADGQLDLNQTLGLLNSGNYSTNYTIKDIY